MDKLYRNVKTGETKPLPIKVYQAVKKHWRPVEEPIVTISMVSGKTNEPEADLIVSIEASEGSAEFVHAGVIENNDITPSKESLQSAYETLTGEKPDGRWSEKKLIQKIEELKETK
jgi:hypothetical protein